jgi:hypothetical protein
MDEAAQIIRLVRGSWLALCVRATCELRIVDALDEPRDLAELAQRTGADPATLFRLLRVLVDERLVAVDSGRYTATTLGELLRDGHPSGLRSMALMQSVAPNLAAWGHLADAVRTGDGVYEEVNGATLWEHLAGHPDEEATFNAAMARRGEQQVAALLTACDLAGVRLLVDVGGGRGAMVTALLEQVPGLHAVVADRPEVARAATEALAAAGLGDRGHGSAADFFSSVPTGGDVYVLSNVLHDWHDDAAVAILRTVRAAMGGDARLLVVESVLDAPEHTAAERAHIHLLDLHMLVMFGARERTKAEYDALLVAAGFTASTSLPSRSSWNVLETRPRE